MPKGYEGRNCRTSAGVAASFTVIKERKKKRGGRILGSRFKGLLKSRNFYSILFLAAVCILFAELYTSGSLSSKRLNQSGIQALRFDWTKTIHETGSIEYTRNSEDAVMVSLKSSGAFVEYEDKSKEFDPACLSAVESILTEHDVNEWNGFNRHSWPIRILDYDADFSLTIHYKI